jgi:hypothetical protein
MCMSSRTQAITNPLGHLLINNKKHSIDVYVIKNTSYHMTYTSMICFFCYLLTGALAGLVIACVFDDIHIYDMFFCYLLTGALVD